MLNPSAFSRGASAGDNRIFVYEISGMQQNEETNRSDCQIRTSSNTFLQVPLNRMNQTSQRISRLGGKIVSIHPLDAASPPPQQAAAKKSQQSKARKDNQAHE